LAGYLDEEGGVMKVFRKVLSERWRPEQRHPILGPRKEFKPQQNVRMLDDGTIEERVFVLACGHERRADSTNPSHKLTPAMVICFECA